MGAELTFLGKIFEEVRKPTQKELNITLTQKCVKEFQLEFVKIDGLKDPSHLTETRSLLDATEQPGYYSQDHNGRVFINYDTKNKKWSLYSTTIEITIRVTQKMPADMKNPNGTAVSCELDQHRIQWKLTVPKRFRRSIWEKTRHGYKPEFSALKDYPTLKKNYIASENNYRYNTIIKDGYSKVRILLSDTAGDSYKVKARVANSNKWINVLGCETGTFSTWNWLRVECLFLESFANSEYKFADGSDSMLGKLTECYKDAFLHIETVAKNQNRSNSQDSFMKKLLDSRPNTDTAKAQSSSEELSGNNKDEFISNANDKFMINFANDNLTLSIRKAFPDRVSLAQGWFAIVIGKRSFPKDAMDSAIIYPSQCRPEASFTRANYTAKGNCITFSYKEEEKGKEEGNLIFLRELSRNNNLSDYFVKIRDKTNSDRYTRYGIKSMSIDQREKNATIQLSPLKYSKVGFADNQEEFEVNFAKKDQELEFQIVTPGSDFPVSFGVSPYTRRVLENGYWSAKVGGVLFIFMRTIKNKKNFDDEDGSITICHEFGHALSSTHNCGFPARPDCQQQRATVGGGIAGAVAAWIAGAVAGLAAVASAISGSEEEKSCAMNDWYFFRRRYIGKKIPSNISSLNGRKTAKSTPKEPASTVIPWTQNQRTTFLCTQHIDYFKDLHLETIPSLQWMPGDEESERNYEKNMGRPATMGAKFWPRKKDTAPK